MEPFGSQRKAGGRMGLGGTARVVDISAGAVYLTLGQLDKQLET